MKLELSNSTVLNSTGALSPLNNPISGLSALLETKGWRDLSSEIYATDSAAHNKEQSLSEALQNYTLQPDARRGLTLLTLLHEAATELKVQYTYAKKQQAHYQKQAEQEAKRGSGFVADWTQWLWHGVQDFFGSSSEALAEKYAQIAKNCRHQQAELSPWIQALQQAALADDLPSSPEEASALSASLEEANSEKAESTWDERHLQPSRHLLQQTTSPEVTVVRPIPNQVVNIYLPYNYSLNEVFSGNYTLLSTPATGPLSLPSWLSLQYLLMGRYPDDSGRAQARGVVVSGSTLFVMDELAGLLILDVSTPSNISLLGNYPSFIGLPNIPNLQTYTPYSIAVSGGTVFVADLDYSIIPVLGIPYVMYWTAGLLILDVSTPSNITLLGRYSTGLSTTANGIVVSGSTVFVVDLNFGLLILDVSMPSHISLLGNYSAGSGKANGVAVSGSTVFVADGNAGLLILDVSQGQLIGIPPLASFGQSLAITISARNLTTVLAETAFALTLDELPYPPLTVVRPIPNQVVNINLPYSYSLNGVFSGNYALLGATTTGASRLPDWLSLQYTLLGSYPVASSAVAVSGSTVFVADWSARLLILDVSTPSTPRLLGSYHTSSSNANGVAVSGSTVFVADGFAGLLILNVSTPSNITLLGSYPAGWGAALGVAVSGSTVFVADGSAGLLILDASRPSNLTLLSRYPVDSSAVAVSGSTVVVVAGGLRILDVSTPSTPRLLGSFPVGFTLGIAVSGSTVFVANNPGLLILDVSQGQLTGVPPFASLGQSIAITISASNFTTVVETAFTLTPDQLPYHIKTTVSDQSVFPGSVLSLHLSSDLFVNPGNSFLRLSLQSKGSAVLPWLALTLSAPIIMSRYSAGIGNALGVVVSGSTVFVADNYVGLLILDVSTPSNPVLLGNYSTGTGGVDCVVVLGSLVYIGIGFNQLLIVDVSIPSTPRLLGSYPSGASNVVVSGSTLYAAAGTAGLLIVDVSTPSIPRLLGSYSTGLGFAYSVAVSGSTVFVTGLSGGLLILDVSTPSIPVLLGSYPTGSGQVVVAVSGSTLYVADGSAGLLIVDVSVPSAPRLLGNYTGLDIFVEAVTVSGSTVFVWESGLENELLILDVSTPSTPRLLGSYLYIGDAYGVAVSGSTVFVAAGNELMIVDVSQWALTATPTVTDVGNYQLQLIGTDAIGGTASVDFTLRVEGPPQIHGRISLQYAPIDRTFNYFVPQGLFMDPNQDPITFTALQSDGQSLPSWLSFNSVSAAFTGNPQVGNLGTLNLTIRAKDNVPGTIETNITFLLLVGSPIIPPSAPLYQGRWFNFPVPNSTFAVEGLSFEHYTALQSDGASLPSWLTFDNRTLQFSGVPLLNDTLAFSLNLNVVATNDQNDTLAAPLTFLVMANSALQIKPLSTQTATVGDPFDLSVSDVFINPSGYPLSYATSQVGGDPLPDWLHFNRSDLRFSGTPGPGDTNFYALRILQMALNASDGVVEGSTIFTLNVGGASWGEQAVKIIAPLVSVLTALLTLYELRAYGFNRCRKGRYQKPARHGQVGEHLTLPLATKRTEQIRGVAIRLPAEQSRCCQFFKLPRPLPGDVPMLPWLEYDPITNQVMTKAPIPDNVSGRVLVIQVWGDDGVILEQFELSILPRPTQTLRDNLSAQKFSSAVGDIKNQKSTDLDQRRETAVTIHDEKSDVEMQLLVSSSPTPNTRKENKEIPLIQKKKKSHPRKDLSTRPLPLAPDSPLRTPTPPPSSNSPVSSHSRSCCL